jgi:large subunit ribosomal protein L13
MKTYSPRPRDVERRWYVIDAGGAVLGRVASEAAAVLRGKHKPIFAPHMDTGDHVIVINAKDVRVTGGKEATKFAYRHSGYPGGITAIQYERLLAEKPTVAVEKAIRGMLPHNRLGRAMARKLQVYPGPEHPHRAQKPEPLALGSVPKWEGLPPRAAAPVEEAPPAGRPPTSRSRSKAPGARSAAKPSAAGRRSAAATSASRSEANGRTPAARKPTARKPAARKPTARKPASSSRRPKKEE